MAGVNMPDKKRKGAMETLGDVAAVGASVASIKKGFAEDPKAPETPAKEPMGPPSNLKPNDAIKRREQRIIRSDR